MLGAYFNKSMVKSVFNGSRDQKVIAYLMIRKYFPVAKKIIIRNHRIIQKTDIPGLPTDNSSLSNGKKYKHINYFS